MILSGISPYLRYCKIQESTGLTPAYIDPEYTFTYVRYGSGTFLLEDGRYRVTEGHCLLIPPYMLHIVNTDGNRPMGQNVLHFDLFDTPSRHGAVVGEPGMDFQSFNANRDNQETVFCDMPRISTPMLKSRHEIERILAEIKNEHEVGGVFCELGLKARLLELLRLHFVAASGMTGNSASTANVPQVWRNLERAIKFIHEHYARNIDLADMTRAAGLSPNYFCQLFHEYSGCTPRKYLNTVRVKEAERLICDSQMNFSEIAECCGFGSLHNFSKVFKRIEGISPSDFSKAKPVPMISSNIRK